MVSVLKELNFLMLDNKPIIDYEKNCSYEEIS